ncbi:MAG TPA: L-histidine N(alpha)-methyltransferase [Hyphomicrobiales bacterium]|nr:L-histidine N(alpha)-methyltransferase [Hyphomicrobiales bacterium]
MNTAKHFEMSAADGEFADAVIAGLRASPKAIPSRFFYDARGSELFERITELGDYYPTNAEIALLEHYRSEIAKLAGPGVKLVEFGSGSSRKTDRLIEALPSIASYVPIDISDSALTQAVARLKARFPDLAVHPLYGDFNQKLDLSAAPNGKITLGFFPGSTIGNLTHDDARRFLENSLALLGRRSAFLVGVDLKKDTGILLPAYNDRKGITAAFNLNLLIRINRELGGTFDLDGFSHEAVYNETQGRIEMHIRSLKAQSVQVLSEQFAFAEGETIHTENSHKYSVEEFQELSRAAGWEPLRSWTGQDRLFSLHYLVPAS